MPAAARSAFDVAFKFSDNALDNNEYLQPQKLQRLMFLAQCAYAVRHRGRRLMPAVFVADELGPIEPNIYLAFSKGRPDIDVDPRLPEDAQAVLDDVWNRFGHCSTEHLTRITKDTLAYRLARQRANGAEIDHDMMRLSFDDADAMPAALPVTRPKIMRTQTGRSVPVKAWTPAEKPISGN
jgi:uncharacterized phage-associated protein